MPGGDAFEGIVVPEGDPDGLRSAGQRLTGIAADVDGLAAGLTGLPSAIGAWTGPASAAFAGATVSPAVALASASQAFDAYTSALRTGAQRLQEAQDDAERAIDQARDARKAIKAAEAAIENAQGRLTGARAQSAALTVAIVATGPVGSLAGLESQRDASDAAAAEAEGDLSRARTALDHARDDLERAKERGREAMEEGRDAKNAVAAALGGMAPSAGGLMMAGAPGRGGGGGSARPVFGADGRIRRLDLSVDEFDRMPLEDRQQWMHTFQEQYGRRGNFDNWFSNIDGILEYAEDRDTITPGQGGTPGNWFSNVDAAILHGIQNGYARSRGRPVTGVNPGTARWQEFFTYRRELDRESPPAGSDARSKRLWAAGEQASTDYGANVVAPRNGRQPSAEETVFLRIGDFYRQTVVPGLPEGAPLYPLLDPRNQEFTRDVAEGIDDTSGEVIEGARETTSEGREAAREIGAAPAGRKPHEVVEGALETGGQVVEGVVSTNLQVADSLVDAGDDLAEEGARVAIKVLRGN